MADDIEPAEAGLTIAARSAEYVPEKPDPTQAEGGWWFSRRRRQREFDLAMVQAKKINRLKDEIELLKERMRKHDGAVELALERIRDNAPGDHDWKAEASGLAYMICQIHDDYAYAKASLGGDSEFLANSIWNAFTWVDGPLRTYYEAAQTDGPGSEE